MATVSPAFTLSRIRVPEWPACRRLTFNEGFYMDAARLVLTKMLEAIRYRSGWMLGREAIEWRTRHVRQLLGSQVAQAQIVDVGANGGEFVRVCRQAGVSGVIYAFEPQPELNNQIRSAGGPMTVVINKCLSDRTGQTLLYRKAAGDRKATTLRSQGHADGRLSSLSVQQTTLMEVLGEHPINQIDLLKVDAEGEDFLVLKGGESALRQGLVQIVACEISWRSALRGYFPADIQDLLLSCGFTRFFLTQPILGLIPVTGRLPNHDLATANLVAVHETRVVPIRTLGLGWM